MLAKVLFRPTLKLEENVGSRPPIGHPIFGVVIKCSHVSPIRRAQDSNLYGLAPSGFQDRRLTS